MAADQQQAEKATEVDKWNGQKVKFAIDDAVKEAVKVMGYSENTIYVDIKLFTSFLAVAIAGVCLAYSYMVDFEASKPVMGVCVGAYFILSGAVQAATWCYEGNIIMWAYRTPKATMGQSKYPSKLVVSSYVLRYSSDYALTVQTGSECSTLSFSFGDVIDTHGHVHQEKIVSLVERAVGGLTQGDEKKTK